MESQSFGMGTLHFSKSKKENQSHTRRVSPGRLNLINDNMAELSKTFDKHFEKRGEGIPTISEEKVMGGYI